jgi:mannosyltransferase OCH1-like enzyme
MSIPKIIHQTCRNKNNLPEEIKNNIESIKKTNRKWEYHLYDDKDIYDFIELNFGDRVLSSVARINPKYGVVLADLFRYLVVYKFGGVYLDIKSSLLCPLDRIIRNDDSFVISQWRNRFGEEYLGWGIHQELGHVPGGEFQQWHVIAEPGHLFLRHVIDQVIFNIESYSPEKFGVGKYGVLRLSGPICYTLSILPHLEGCNKRFIDSHKCGIRYSFYENWFHHMLDPSHYSNQTEPVIL